MTDFAGDRDAKSTVEGFEAAGPRDELKGLKRRSARAVCRSLLTLLDDFGWDSYQASRLSAAHRQDSTVRLYAVLMHSARTHYFAQRRRDEMSAWGWNVR